MSRSTATRTDALSSEQAQTDSNVVTGGVLRLRPTEP